MPRTCAWCRRELPTTLRADAETCGRKCRQAVWRLRQRADLAEAAGRPMRFAYGDPPYPGRARRYYSMPEVDHEQLVKQLAALGPDGWALSTSADGLRLVLPLCPPEARVCAWVKPIAPSPRTLGLHNTWEPLIVVGGRQRPPGRRDWLSAQPARGGGDLPGRKPAAFVAWLWSCLGALPGDELADLFPGTGIVGRGWAQLSARTSADLSPGPAGDTSATPADDCYPSADAGADLSPEALGDSSPGPGGDAYPSPAAASDACDTWGRW